MSFQGILLLHWICFQPPIWYLGWVSSLLPRISSMNTDWRLTFNLIFWIALNLHSYNTKASILYFLLFALYFTWRSGRGLVSSSQFLPWFLTMVHLLWGLIFERIFEFFTHIPPTIHKFFFSPSFFFDGSKDFIRVEDLPSWERGKNITISTKGRWLSSLPPFEKWKLPSEVQICLWVVILNRINNNNLLPTCRPQKVLSRMFIWCAFTV